VGSAAIDNGSNPRNLTTDQIGNPRQIGPAPDIGAVEAPQSVENATVNGGSSSSSSSQSSASQQSSSALVQAIVLFVLSQPKSGIQLLSLADINGDGIQDIILAVGNGASRRIIAINGATGGTLFTAPAPN
jgi:hypothetical protein